MTHVLTEPIDQAIAEAVDFEGNPLFTAWDRCDRCGAQAYVRIDNGEEGSALLFCNHHFNRHADALMAQGWDTIDDNRQALFDAPRPSL